jgi:hypothetical protein
VRRAGRLAAWLRARAAYLWFAVPLAGGAELAMQFWCEHRAPRFDEYARLRDPIASIKRSGDVVVVSPRWAEPLVRRALGDSLMPIEETARSDVSRFDRAIEVSMMGEHSKELSGFHEVAKQEVGPFELRALENSKVEPVVYDFVSHVRPPDATVFGTDPEVHCDFSERAQVLSGGLSGHPTFPRERFLCPGGEFFNVGVTVIADEKFLPRRCIWSHPFEHGALVTRFDGVTLGERITGHGGMYWVIERDRAGAPIELQVAVDGDVVGTYVHRDGDGWSSFDFGLGDHAHATKATVEFRVSTANYLHRHFCFEATSR